MIFSRNIYFRLCVRYHTNPVECRYYSGIFLIRIPLLQPEPPESCGNLLSKAGGGEQGLQVEISAQHDALHQVKMLLPQWRCCYSPCVSRASRPRPRSHSVPAGVGRTTEPLPSSFSHLYRDRGHSSQPFQLGLATQVSTS